MTTLSSPNRTGSRGSTSSSSSSSSSTASPSLFSSSDEQNSSNGQTSSTSTTPPNHSSKESGSDSPAPAGMGSIGRLTAMGANGTTGHPLPIYVKVNAQAHDYDDIQRQVEAALNSLLAARAKSQQTADASTIPGRSSSSSSNHHHHPHYPHSQQGASRARFRPSDEVLAAGVKRLRMGDVQRHQDENDSVRSIQDELVRAREDLFAPHHDRAESEILDSVIQRFQTPNRVDDKNVSAAYDQGSLRNARSSETITNIRGDDFNSSKGSVAGTPHLAHPQPISSSRSSLYDAYGFVPVPIAATAPTTSSSSSSSSPTSIGGVPASSTAVPQLSQ